MDREIEYLQQQIQYLERALETCMAHISSLEARVAELERRPVAVPPQEEPARARGAAEGEWLLTVDGVSHRWVTVRPSGEPDPFFTALTKARRQR
jgi:hypothetical protein